MFIFINFYIPWPYRNIICFKSSVILERVFLIFFRSSFWDCSNSFYALVNFQRKNELRWFEEMFISFHMQKCNYSVFDFFLIRCFFHICMQVIIYFLIAVNLLYKGQEKKMFIFYEQKLCHTYFFVFLFVQRINYSIKWVNSNKLIRNYELKNWPHKE